MFGDPTYYILRPNVYLGRNCFIGAFSIIGALYGEMSDGQVSTRIGGDANIRSHTVIYASSLIGKHFQTGHGVLIREHCHIGDNVSIGSHSVIEHHVTIEDGVRIHSNVFIPEYTRLLEGCWIGPNVTFTNTLHPLCPKVKECIGGPVIGSGAKIGAGAVILPRRYIGENALIGAGAVVVTNVPEGAVMVGNPARQIKTVDQLDCRYELIDHPYEEEA